MRALLTGSNAYGTPSAISDVDLVVLSDRATIRSLEPHISGGHHGSAESHNASFVFGRLNLILVTETRDARWWAKGTALLKAERPVSRARAVDVLERFRQLDLQDVHDTRAGLRTATGQPVPLEDAACLPGGQQFYPPAVRALNRALYKDPNDRTAWGVMADWLEDREHPTLASGARYLFHRPDVSVERNWYTTGSDMEYDVFGLPPAVSVHWGRRGFCLETPLGVAAAVAGALDLARRDLE